MPEIGEIKGATEIGHKRCGHHFIWQACCDCGKLRWVVLYKGLPKTKRCHPCAAKVSNGRRWGSGSPVWKGGRGMVNGYVTIRLSPDNFFYPMVNASGYVMEHRLVVAKALNRCLLPWEVVHHKGTKYPIDSKENRSDNRYPENLELIKGKGRHNCRIERELRKQAREISILKQRVTLLEAENVQLRNSLQLVES